MLPAIGAASLALDAIQSLTSPPSKSSQPTGFGPALSDAEDSSDVSPASTAVSGYSSAQISSENFNALIDAQSLRSQASASFTQALDDSVLTSDSPSARPASASDTASSTYNAMDQLMQSTAVPLGFNPFSVSV
jgi:hypothetical protein